MEFSNKTDHPKHISFEDLERLSALDPNDISKADIDWALRINEMIDNCDICNRRYSFFVDTRAVISSFSAEKKSFSEKVIQYFRKSLLQTDQILQDKLSEWLESSRNFMNDLNQMTLRPATAVGTRGLEDAEDTVNLVIPDEGDTGFFEFELKKEAILNFSIKKETANGQPVCLAIFGREDMDFSQLYPLTSFGKDHLRAKTPQKLPVGKYVLCVPTMRADE